MAAKNNAPTGNLLNDFVGGVKRAVDINLYVQIPNFIMAFVLIRALNYSGLMDIISKVLTPVMGIFGLPGEAGAILATGWLSTSGAIGALAALYDTGVMTGAHIAIVLPMCFMIGGQLQMLGRILAPAKTPTKYYPAMFIIGFISCVFVGLLMNLIVNLL